jgi:Ca2+-binding EF-hand superfamily protein
MRKLLNRDQFVQLFKTSFGFLAVSRIHADLLHGFFAKIDTDRDGFITFEQYITWLKDFLCPTNYRGDAYYF